MKNKFNRHTLIATLVQNKIKFKRFDHKPVFSVEDGIGVSDHIKGIHIKNLFLKDKKKNLWLITMPTNITINLKILRKYLKSSGNLSFCSKELLFEKLNCHPGSVNPLAIINNYESDINLIFDNSLNTDKFVCPHPMDNKTTLQIKGTEMLNFINSMNKNFIFIDFKKENLLL